MVWTSPLAYFITALCYAAAALLAWMPMSYTGSESLSGAQSTTRFKLLSAFLLLAIFLHGMSSTQSIFVGTGINLSFAEALSLIALLSMAIYTALGWSNNGVAIVARFIAPFVMPLAYLPAVLTAERFLSYGDDTWFKLHFAVAFLAYALYTIATIHALLTAASERILLRGSRSASLANLPPLLKMEKLLFSLLTAAFVFLTLTLLTGTIFSERLFGKPFEVTHKTVFAVMSWLVFGGLLLGNWRWGWRGRLAVRWTLIGFVMLLLSYVGSKFVLEIILHR